MNHEPHDERSIIGSSKFERKGLQPMSDIADIKTEVEIKKGPNLFGAQFYGFSVDFSVIEFPEDAPEDIRGRGAVGVMRDLASTLEEAGWQSQAVNIRAAANELAGELGYDGYTV